ncbi:acetyl esterase/lipase [Pseudacidovorax sp. 1753]|uniref:alpha/beta hydrolase n=1 Tax=Pseudacidovorax sp. 1753 TaxID=3156419 RepID=UPI00339B6531
MPSHPPLLRTVAAALAVVAGALSLGACSPIKLVDRLTPTDTYTVQNDIAYGSEPRQRLDVYQPLARTAPAAGRRPLVVFFYGGTWTTGDRAQYRFVGEALASRGAIVAVADYRLSHEVRYPAFVQDSARAVKWGLDNAARLGADPAQVYVMGHSSGAYNAAMVALDPRWLQALGASPRQLAGWIGLAGPYDFLPIGDPDVKRAFDWPRTMPESQPINHVSAAAPRTLLMAASRDNLVDPHRNTAQMARKLEVAGVPVEVHTFDNLSHITLMGAVATRVQWIGGPVMPPLLRFLGLAPSDSSHRPAQ